MKPKDFWRVSAMWVPVSLVTGALAGGHYGYDANTGWPVAAFLVATSIADELRYRIWRKTWSHTP